MTRWMTAEKPHPTVTIHVHCYLFSCISHMIGEIKGTCMRGWGLEIG